MPWTLAAFISMLWLVPFDAMVLPVSLPFDSKLDRFVLGLLVASWIIAALAGRRMTPGRVRSPVAIAILVFFTLAAASIVVNATALAQLGELSLATKKLILLGSYCVFFFLVASIVRRTEVRAFITLTIALAAIAALGTIIEYRTNVNYFYDAVAGLPSLSIGSPPADSEFGRPSTVGPTSHGLAIATMLAMALPFAVVRLGESSTTRRRIVYGLLVAVILAGALATVRKTSIFAIALPLVVLTVYRPRFMFRLLPLGIVIALVVSMLAPGAVGGIRSAFKGGAAQNSTTARTDDYPAVAPNVIAHPLLGRGYGSYDPRAIVNEGTWVKHRTLDNELLGLVLEAGILGLAAFLAISGTAVVAMHRMIRRGPSGQVGLAIATIGAVLAFGVGTFTFDAMAFPHVPYIFFLTLGLAAVLARDIRHIRPVTGGHASVANSGGARTEALATAA